jgi:hypothetical protein
MIKENIDDFLQIYMSQLKKRFTLVSFTIRLSKSYVDQIMVKGVIFFFDEKAIQKYVTSLKVKLELSNTKKVAVLIPSRHKWCKK